MAGARAVGPPHGLVCTTSCECGRAVCLKSSDVIIIIVIIIIVIEIILIITEVLHNL